MHQSFQAVFLSPKLSHTENTQKVVQSAVCTKALVSVWSSQLRSLSWMDKWLNTVNAWAKWTVDNWTCVVKCWLPNDEMLFPILQLQLPSLCLAKSASLFIFTNFFSFCWCLSRFSSITSSRFFCGLKCIASWSITEQVVLLRRNIENLLHW